MKYCTYCGAELKDDDNFCVRCGEKTVDGMYYNYSHQAGHDVVNEREPLDKLVNELAYIGTLFWLPLILGKRDDKAKYHANQGLWVLICSVIACTLLRISGYINGLCPESFGGIIMHAIYSIIFLGFLIFMGFLFVQVIVRAQAVHNDEDPKAILWFEKYTLIR